MPGSPAPNISLLQRSSMRFISTHRLQSLLTFIGVMLGVSMVVAVDLANSSARRAFALSLESVTGPVTHQIIGGPSGIDEGVYSRLRRELGVRSSAPVITAQVRIKDKSFMLIGSDPLSEASINRHTLGFDTKGLSAALTKPNGVILSERTAKILDLSPGQSFPMRIAGGDTEVLLVAVFSADNPAAVEGLIFADIAVAQSLLKRLGKLDRIDLVLDEITDLERVKSWLPGDLILLESETRNHSLQQMSEAFHINLTAMSLLALLVASLLIYNTMTLSVLQRRTTLGIYRALGVSRREIFVLIMSETLVLAVAASAMGLVFGLLLGQSLVQLVTRTINDLYFNLHVTAFLINPLSLIKGFALGVGMALISAFLPALEATHTDPIGVQQRSSLEQRWRLRLPIFLILGLALIASGMLLASRNHGSLEEGFVALTLMVLGFCLIVPGLVMGITRLILVAISPLPINVIRMAVRGITAGISRTGLAIAALTVAVSVTVGVGVMVGSFRHTVVLWLEQTLKGDIYISPTERNNLAPLASLINLVQRLEGVDLVTSSRILNIETEFGQVRLMAMTPGDADTSLPLKEDIPGSIQQFHQGNGVLVSEPLAYHQQLSPGDNILLHTQKGPRQFPILGIFYDYTSSRGMIAMHHNLYRHWWDDESISGLTVYRSRDTSQETLLGNVRELIAAADGEFVVSSNQEIRQVVMSIFDRTFVITDVLRFLAVLVAFVGVLSALIALQLERVREFGVLRAIGMTRLQIQGMIVGQTSLIGLIAGVMAVPLGLIMAEVLIEVINRRAFGWTMQQQLPAHVLIQALMLAITAALLASVYPAYRASSISPAQALREE